MALPGWVKSNAESVRTESERFRTMSEDERGRLVQVACRAAMKLLEGRADREAIMAHRDPLPQSTVEILARLRAKRG